MKLKHLFTVNIFFALFFGVTCAFFAGWALSFMACQLRPELCGLPGWPGDPSWALRL